MTCYLIFIILLESNIFKGQSVSNEINFIEAITTRTTKGFFLTY